MSLRLAHFSDLHFTQMPLAAGFELKRIGALGSYLAHRRRWRFARVEAQVAALLGDVDAQRVDHVLCTGDLTGVASDEEFSRAVAALAPLLAQPARFTCLAGNHDRYLSKAAGAFERAMGAAAFPPGSVAAKDLGGHVTLVAVETARPTPLGDSSGAVTPGALQALRDILHERRLAERFVVLALHYGLQRRDGTPDAPSHGLRDAAELIGILDAPGAAVDLVVHGHLHRAFVTRTERRWIVNAGSATDLGVPCGYFVYDIDPAHRAVRLERRSWRAAAYAPPPGDTLERLIQPTSASDAA